MTTVLPEVDVALVGLGAVTGVVAHVLAAAGMDVAGLEAGPRLARDDFTLDEIRNDMRAWLAQPKAAHEIPTWREDPSSPARPSPWPMLMMNAVGGTSIHYDGLSIRFNPWNFASRTRTIERYGAGAIPPGSTIADWPLSYDELEPFYAAVEQAIGVSGEGASVAGSPTGAGNPFEGARSTDFPMPALRSSGFGAMLGDAALRLGWHPFRAPAAINTEPYDGRPACAYCGFCLNNGCYRDAKGSTSLNVIRRAEDTGNLRIETWARVVRIETDGDGLASGVEFVRDGETFRQPARAVVIGTFVYENSRLLLLSKSRAHPAGLSNGHGQVGKHYIAHYTPIVFGLFPGRRLNMFSGNGSQTTCVDDFNADNFDHDGAGFVGGGMMTTQNEYAPIAFAQAIAPPGVRRWGSGWKRWMRSNAQSVGSVYAQFDAGSYETNYLDLDPVVRDPHGVPVVRVTHRLYDNEQRGYEFLGERMRRWLREAGAETTWEPAVRLLEGRHCYGGTRMGDDPATSVVDRHGMSHEVPNLAIVGASTFPTAGGGNPTLTAQATAWRTAEHIVRSWGAIARGA